MKKHSLYILSTIMLISLVWMLYIAIELDIQYSLLFVPNVLIPVASFLHTKGEKHEGTALLLEVLSFIAIVAFTIIMLLPF